MKAKKIIRLGSIMEQFWSTRPPIILSKNQLPQFFLRLNSWHPILSRAIWLTRIYQTSLKQTQGQPAFLSVGQFSIFFENNAAPGLKHFEALINFITSIVTVLSCCDSMTSMTDCMKFSTQKRCAQINEKSNL